MAELFSVPEVARRLGVDDSRVRQLIRSGDLHAMRVGGRWVLPASALDVRQRHRHGPGRPFSARSAWGLLIEASGRRASWLDRSERSRARKRMRELFTRKDEEVVASLRGRARMHRLFAHPAALKRILDEPGIVRSGASAAHDVGADIIAGDVVEVYAQDVNFEQLVRRYRLRSSEDGNLIVRVPPGIWPFNSGETVAPPIVVAVDLLEAADDRSRRAGAELIIRTLAVDHHDQRTEARPGSGLTARADR